jgi:hypothetical protein
VGVERQDGADQRYIEKHHRGFYGRTARSYYLWR